MCNNLDDEQKEQWKIEDNKRKKAKRDSHNVEERNFWGNTRKKKGKKAMYDNLDNELKEQLKIEDTKTKTKQNKNKQTKQTKMW